MSRVCGLFLVFCSCAAIVLASSSGSSAAFDPVEHAATFIPSLWKGPQRFPDGVHDMATFQRNLTAEEEEMAAVAIEPGLRMITRGYANPYMNAYKVKRKLFKTKSKFQRISVVESRDFGNIMVIDDDLMLTERDEFHYHEMMVNVPMAYIPHAKRALVIGGGDGGTLREVLRHPNIENATMVDIDKKVIDTAKRFFANTSASFFHPRATVFFLDGAEWARKRCSDPEFVKYDLVVIDSTDFSAAVPLFEVSFYRAMKDCVLRPGGILIHNLDSLSWDMDTVRLRTARMKEVFKFVTIYQVFQPTYSGGHYAVNFASDEIEPFRTPVDWEAFRAKKMALKYYNPDIHYASFILPAFVHMQLHGAIPIEKLENVISRPPRDLGEPDVYYSQPDVFEPIKQARREEAEAARKQAALEKAEKAAASAATAAAAASAASAAATPESEASTKAREEL